MKERKRMSRIIATCLTVIMCSTLLVTAGATEERGVCHLTFHANPGGNPQTSLIEGNGSNVTGGYWLYHLADISSDETKFITREKYKDILGDYIETTYTPLDVAEPLTKDTPLTTEIGSIASSESALTPDYSVNIVDGIAEFTDLPEGLYYGIGQKMTMGRNEYTPIPIILSVPYMYKDASNDSYLLPASVTFGINANVKYFDFNANVLFNVRTLAGGGGGASRPSNPPSPSNPPAPDNPPASASSISSVVCADNIVKVVATGNDDEDYLFCAVYNDNGQMLDYRKSFIGGKERLQFEFASVEFSYAKAFMMDENGKPVCESKTSIESVI